MVIYRLYMIKINAYMVHLKTCSQFCDSVSRLHRKDICYFSLKRLPLWKQIIFNEHND